MSAREELAEIIWDKTDGTDEDAPEIAADAILAAGYHKGTGTQRQGRVIGRICWDRKNRSPWMTFDHITAFRKWTTAVRKARPGVKTEYAYINLCWTAESMLSNLQHEAKENRA